MNFKCKYCNHTNQLIFDKKYAGKRISIKCSNCNEDLIIKFKDSKNDSVEETIISQSMHRNIKGAKLVVKENQYNEKQEYIISLGRNLIGRKSNNSKANIQVYTSDSNMSRLHCSIDQKNDSSGHLIFILKDENSLNGTVLNETTLDKTNELYLVNKDVIRLGETELIFKTIE